jgi:large repetitive protein
MPKVRFALLAFLLLMAAIAAPAQAQTGTGTVQIIQGGTGNGSVTSEPSGINCTINGSTGPSGACSAQYPFGTRVKLTARPAPDSIFRGWAPVNSCPDGGNVTVQPIGRPHNCRPVFELKQPPSFLGTTHVGSGTINSSPAGINNCTFDSDAQVRTGQCSANFASGTLVTLSATPLAGWSFSHWSGNQADCNDGVVRMDAARSCTANFVRGGLPPPPPPQTFTLTITKKGQGTVTSSPAGINCGADCSEAYASGTVVTLSATPAAGWTFDKWTGQDKDCEDGVVTMNAAKTCTAEFRQ